MSRSLESFEFNSIENENSCDNLELVNVELETDFLPELTTESTENYFQNFYKSKNTHQSSQSKRREELLKEQKRRRNESIDISRGILSENVVEKEPENVPKTYKSRYKKYNNKLMMSEWLIEVPEDLSENWFFKICPNAHRCIVVAEKHKTKCFNKKGNFEEQFRSLLPGSDRNQNPTKTTILDCLWDYKNQCFYVLDVLVWAGNDLTDYNAEFRFFWLQSQLKDIYELQNSTDSNTYPFKYIDHYLTDRDTILEKFYDHTENIDGILFYHRDSSYMSGRTPLVGWLKPFMIPEILKININHNFLLEKPEKYIDLKGHIEYGNYMRSKKKSKHDQMEIEIDENPKEKENRRQKSNGESKFP